MPKLNAKAFVLTSQKAPPSALSCALCDKYEFPVAMRRPVPVHGRLDRVTISQLAEVYVTDTKSRSHHYVTMKDVLQVSWGRMLCLYSNDAIFKTSIGKDASLSFPERAFIHTVDRTDMSEEWHTVRTVRPSILIPMFLDYYARSDASAKHSAA